MFDGLSAVAEITGVDYDKWLSDLYGNDELKKQQAIDPAQAVQAQTVSRQRPRGSSTGPRRPLSVTVG